MSNNKNKINYFLQTMIARFLAVMEAVVQVDL